MTYLDTKAHYQNMGVARRYDRERFSSWVGRAFDGLEKRAIRRLLTRGAHDLTGAVLDCPCGTGRITELLLDLGYTVTGGDISEAMLDVARQKCVRAGDQVVFRQLDLDGLDLADGAFGLISCIRLFHHIGTEVRSRILRELARVSSRYVLINVAVSTPYYRLRRRVKRWLGQGVSRAGSTWAEIAQEAKAAGLTLHDFQYVCRFGSEDLILLFRKADSSKL
jgi:ubiquinone/menaquinone biosynthesis C-methylase UbiE